MSPTAPRGWCVGPCARDRGAAGSACDQPCGRLPRRAAHGGAVARAVVLCARNRAAWNSRPGIACLTTVSRRMPAVLAQRMTALSRLVHVEGRDKPSVLLTTVNATLQRVPPRDLARRAIAVGRARQCARDGACRELARTQRLYARLDRARARRLRRCAAASSICFRPGWTSRCGSISSATSSKSIRAFDPETQRTQGELRELDLVPVAEFQLTTDTIRKFRTWLCRSLRRGDARRPAL